MAASDYHNGPLSVIITFGIFGVIGFIWFLVAACRGLYFNYRYGDPELHNINATLLALFLARILLFLFIFGGFYGDMAHFAGIIGLSLALNGGIRRFEPAPAVQKPAEPLCFRRPLKPAPGLARAPGPV
jgi:hypothetical protein